MRIIFCNYHSHHKVCEVRGYFRVFHNYLFSEVCFLDTSLRLEIVGGLCFKGGAHPSYCSRVMAVSSSFDNMLF